MKKRVALIMMIAVLTVVLSGCSALFFDRYYSEKDFQGNQSIDLDSDIQMVQNYAELRRHVFNMMNNHEESTQLRFVGYSGNAVSDIASVCNAVKTESAYGAYCVDYVSYDMTQIVSYYEASIAISFKYTQEELAALKTTNNHNSFSELLAEELTKETPKVIVKVNNGSGENAVVSELINQTIRENPLSLSYYPQFSVKIYSGNSSQKIYEVNFQYDERINNSERIEKIKNIILHLEQKIAAEDELKLIADAAMTLKEHCLYHEMGGNTAYDALANKEADSEGFASAFKTLCDRLNVECLTVNGRLDREEHFWNIVKIGNAYYHIDVSALIENEENVFFKRDEEQQINYWWDQSIYPDCNGEIIYLERISD